MTFDQLPSTVESAERTEPGAIYQPFDWLNGLSVAGLRLIVDDNLLPVALGYA